MIFTSGLRLPDDTPTREPRPGEVCTCGRPAVVVYIAERFGDVPSCDLSEQANSS